MKKTRILVLGPKEYPFGSGSVKGELPGGGADVFFENLSSNLDSEKVEFHLVTQQYPGQLPFEQIGNLFVYRVSWVRGRYRTVTAIFLSFLKSLRIDYDLVFTILEPPLLLGYFLAKFKRKKLYCRLGGFSGKNHKLKDMKLELAILKSFNKFVLPHSDKVIFASETEKSRFEESMSINLSNSKIIKTGIKIIGDKKIDNNLKRKFVILFVGRLEKVKGIDVLLESMVKINNSVLWIVGSGREETNLKLKASKMGLSDKVRFWGFSSEVKKFLLSSDIFVLPSRSEGTPHSLIEAMSVGLPIIASDIGLSCIKDGHSALIFRSEDSIDLTNKINALLSSFELRKEIGNNGKHNFLKNHSINQMCSKYHEIFTE